MPMRRFLQIGVFFLALASLVLPLMSPLASASDLDKFFNYGNYPVNYDATPQIGRGIKSPDSIDSCLLRKEYFYNEVHNVWVEGLVRCKTNSKGVMSKATFNGLAEEISTDPADEQLCVQKREGQIIVNGVPSESEARRWSERCSYLGTIGGAGPPGTSSTSSTSNYSQFFSSNTSTGSSSGSSVNLSGGPLAADTPVTVTEKQAEDALIARIGQQAFNNLSFSEQQAQIAAQKQALQSAASSSSTPLIYDGPGIQVPDESLVASGISKERSLIQLIVFYTNATLPYVSVISVFVFVAAGLFYILSFTNEELNGKAKNMMIYVVIGIVIIFSAYTIVNTLLSFSTFQQ